MIDPDNADTLLDRLRARLRATAPLAVAVSGGVDSMTLAVVAGRELGSAARMLHATSAAVPADATARVRRYAEREGWALRVVDAGEFADPNYRANPVDRCFFCKSNLYSAMSVLKRIGDTDATLCSGTNTDDLGDYRPGLRAAADHHVSHPYVDAAIDKSGVRAIARRLRLDDLAELPAAPCLSSRVETGIAIDPAALAAIDAVEKHLRATLNPRTVRCRLRRDRIAVELDAETLAALGRAEQNALRALIDDAFAAVVDRRTVTFTAYRMGSAFLRDRDAKVSTS